MKKWEDMSQDEAKSFVNRLTTGKTGAEWEKALKAAVSCSSTSSSPSQGYGMWMGQWIAYHNGKSLSGVVIGF